MIPQNLASVHFTLKRSSPKAWFGGVGGTIYRPVNRELDGIQGPLQLCMILQSPKDCSREGAWKMSLGKDATMQVASPGQL